MKLLRPLPASSSLNFQETSLYMGWLATMLAFPDHGGQQKVLEIAYSIYCRVRFRHRC